MNGYGAEQSRKDPAQLEHEIDQQRMHIESLVQALEHKLTPGEIFEQVLGRAGGGREFAGNLGDTVKANPVPTLLTVAGLAWLYAGKDRQPADTQASDRDDKPHFGERVDDMRHDVSGTLGAAKSHAADSVHGASQAIRHQAQRAGDGYQHLLNDNPMALGAIGIAVGALLGALLPATRREDEWMGRRSERIKEDTMEMARSGYDKVVEAGREATDPHARSSSSGDGRYHAGQSPSDLGAGAENRTH